MKGFCLTPQREVTGKERDQSHKYLRARACDRGVSLVVRTSHFLGRVMVILQLLGMEARKRRNKRNDTYRNPLLVTRSPLWTSTLRSRWCQEKGLDRHAGKTWAWFFLRA